jgi:hypothetical protein
MNDHETLIDEPHVMTGDVGDFRRAAGAWSEPLIFHTDDVRVAVPEALRRRSDRLLDRTMREWGEDDDDPAAYD